MRDPTLKIACSVADAGALYAQERWMQGEAEAVRELWRRRVYDAIFAGIVHALDLHKRAIRQRRKRQRFVLAWCLTCRAQVRVPRSTGGHKVKCATCGNEQVAHCPAPEAGADRGLDVSPSEPKEISHE